MEMNAVSVIEAIKTRRSIRSFKDDKVPYELLKEIVDAARYAPSGGNIQPWVFIIIRDAETKKKVHTIVRERTLRYLGSPEGQGELEKYGEDVFLKYMEAIKSGRFQEHIIKAPILIAVFGDTKSPYYIHDCCTATENLILAAHSLGLGSCWIDHGIGDNMAEDQIRKLLKVPENYKIVSLIAIGFAAETPKSRAKKEVHEIAFLNKYNNSIY